MGKNRNYGIDLLRVVSMLMIITLHMLGHGGVLSATAVLSPSYMITWFLEIASYCAVNCYALISGYVSYNSNFKYSNLINLYIQVAFYSTVILLFIKCIYTNEYTLLQVFKNSFPLKNKYYWYFNAYFGTAILIPIFNAAIINLNKFKCYCLMTMIFIWFSIMPDFFGLNNGYGVLWIMLLYLLGGCIAKTGFAHSVSNKKLLCTYLAMTLLTFCVKITLEYLHIKGYPTISPNTLIKYTSPTILINSVVLLVAFSKMSLKKTTIKIVKLLASSSFSVYLIHDNPYIRALLFKNKLLFLNQYTEIKMVITLFIIIILIYLLCTIIDLIRIKIFEIFKIRIIVDRVCVSVSSYLDKIIK